MRLAIVASAALGLVAMAPSAPLAHHSMSMFDQNEVITVAGTVREFQWANPHAYIQLQAPTPSGGTQEWSLEMGSPMYLYARGWRPRTLRPGTEVRVRINPLRSGRPGGAVLDVTDAEGNPIGTNQ